MKIRHSIRSSHFAAFATLCLASSLAASAWALPNGSEPASPAADAGRPSLPEPVANDSAGSDDKSQYHLFKRTPRALMREMATDRPDTTESPISVDAGHLQLETEMVNMERDQGTTDPTFGSLNLKLGLASWTDFQIVFDLFHRTGGENDVGDLTFRNKINLWGNDGGSSALALMPFITLPASRLGPGYVEGGFIVPLGLEGPAGWEFATMLELDAVRRTNAYGMDLVATATAGHAIWEPLGGFVEIASVTPFADEDVVLSGNSGLVLALSDDVMLDGGVRVGLTDSATDLAMFLGGSGRY